MAGERSKKDGVLHFGPSSMSYAGLLSFIYAEMEPTDVRVMR